MSGRRIACALFAGVVGTVASAAAQGNRPGSLRAAAATVVAVESERIDLVCMPGEDENALLCELRVVWTLHNPTEAAASAAIVFNWPFDAPLTVRVGGGDVGEPPLVRPLSVLVAAGQSSEVELSATVRLTTPYLGTGSAIPTPLSQHDALSARHPLLSTPWEIAARGMAWVRPDDLRFASVGPTHVHVVLPPGWTAVDALHEASEDGQRVFVHQTPERNAPRVLGLHFSRGSRGEIVRHGGPFLGLGGTVDQGIRFRVGYEIGWGEFVLTSISLDTDFQHQVVITPLVEIASWSMIILPSMAIGVGVPIQAARGLMAPRSDVGIRFEASATLYAIGVVADLDVWPADAGWQLSVLGRLGL